MEISMNQTKIMVSEVYKYLGVKIDRNLTFSDHLDRTMKRASCRVQLLLCIKHNISPSTAEGSNCNSSAVLQQCVPSHGTIKESLL